MYARFVLIFSYILIVLTLFYNIIGISQINIISSEDDIRLSSFISANEIKDRISNESVFDHFLYLTRELYEGMNIVVPENLFRENDLKAAGFARINYEDTEKYHPKFSGFFFKISLKSLWYNPEVFSAKDYKKISRQPLQFEPPLSMDYPAVILFVESDSKKYGTIKVILCERYVIFIPANTLAILD